MQCTVPLDFICTFDVDICVFKLLSLAEPTEALRLYHRNRRTSSLLVCILPALIPSDSPSMSYFYNSLLCDKMHSRGMIGLIKAHIALSAWTWTSAFS